MEELADIQRHCEESSNYLAAIAIMKDQCFTVMPDLIRHLTPEKRNEDTVSSTV
ncbi:MAG: hypothetical protein ABJG78_17400 [Cyclobacteriaceae bacterium]